MSNTSNELVAALLSAATKTKISSYEDLPNVPNNEATKCPVDLVNLHSILLKRGPVSVNRSSSDAAQLFIRTLTGQTKTIACSLTETVGHLKSLISVTENIAVDQQRLIFGGLRLEDGRPLSHYNIVACSTLHLVLRLMGGGPAVLLYLDPKFRSPQFDYDFQNVNDDGIVFQRGGFVYGRPIGTIRIALNVMGKYGENTWLGVNGRASIVSDVPGEWAVSYHGTGMNNAKSIAADGYLLSRGKRFAFGYGIYSTPDIAVAMRYAATFTHGDEQYKFVIQNRVNPTTVKRVLADETCGGEYWITEKEGDIRPYGICFLKC